MSVSSFFCYISDQLIFTGERNERGADNFQCCHRYFFLLAATKCVFERAERRLAYISGVFLLRRVRCSMLHARRRVIF